MAQIKVGTGLTNSKSINVFRNGAWAMKRVGKVFKNGLWQNFIKYGTYLYSPGVEHVAFETEMIYPTYEWFGFSVTDTPTHKRINAYSPAHNQSGEMFIRTTLKVNLTTYSKLKMELGTVTSSVGSFGYLAVSPNEEDYYSYPGTVAKASFYGDSVGRIIEVDVSSLSGEFYVKVGASTANNPGITMDIINIWLE